ncbi:hypothetical protein I5R92_15090 [Pseudomonas carnis]|uniref:colicin-like pore-forming protein n=1 Tax=Pseudomonas carnis TaxID=2487355 RepID=UPI0018D6E311|nr:colicin-like pore-forming protein [Pseudomonas carnis]MBH3368617.1 hypothetical protein [Pseudomonas carnis]
MSYLPGHIDLPATYIYANEPPPSQIGISLGNVAIGHETVDRLMTEAADSGTWPSMDSYEDAGVDYQRVLPLQLKEVKFDFQLSYEADARDVPNTMNSEIDKTIRETGPIIGSPPAESIEQKANAIENVAFRRSQLRKYYEKKLDDLPAKNYLSRTIDTIMGEVDASVKTGNDSLENIMGHELEGIKSSYEIDIQNKIFDYLRDQLDTYSNEINKLDPAALKDSLGFISDTNKEIANRYGAAMGEVAQDLKNNVSGKNINSYPQALVAFEKIQNNPNFKLNQKDAAAVDTALKVLDNQAFSDNLKRLSRGFGVIGLTLQVSKISTAASTGFNTGDWKPLMLEVESIAVGTAVSSGFGALAATGLAAISLPAVATGVGFVFIAVIMAAISAYIDPKTVDKINHLVYTG